MRRIAFLVFALLAVIALASALRAGQEPDGRPQYTNGTSLVLPADYREWTWLSSGLGMTYEVDANRPERPPAFTNVFDSDSMPVFVPPGFLLFLRQQALLAQRFDERALQSTLLCMVYPAGPQSRPQPTDAAVARTNATLVPRVHRAPAIRSRILAPAN